MEYIYLNLSSIFARSPRSSTHSSAYPHSQHIYFISGTLSASTTDDLRYMLFPLAYLPLSGILAILSEPHFGHLHEFFIYSASFSKIRSILRTHPFIFISVGMAVTKRYSLAAY